VFAATGDVMKIVRPPGYPAGEGGGFTLLPPVFGEIIDGDEEDYIVYKHTSAGRQIIQFTSNEAIRPRVFYLILDGITLHDHASLSMGGPAFATYFTGVTRTSQEEGD
jgi:hypothetical protein